MPESERTIFLDALDVAPGEARLRFLASACGDDTALRQSVEALLDAHEEPDHVVDRSPLIEIKARVASNPSEKTQIASSEDDDCNASGGNLLGDNLPGDNLLGGNLPGDGTEDGSPADGIDDVGRLIDGYRLMECIGEG
ncbi:MAG TPA: hypothetical protein DDW52_26870, partial [Planctomycetaceae bacterium]|nr:hypothetical protein [Planctomycetaceae bacterium]